MPQGKQGTPKAPSEAAQVSQWSEDLIILYTNQEGGHWTPFNTPLSVYEIKQFLWSEADNGMIQESEWFYYPNSNLLPVFHSILLPNAARWDARRQHWTGYQLSGGFVDWWRQYVNGYNPQESDLDREKNIRFWKDQGPGTICKEFEEYVE